MKKYIILIISCVIWLNNVEAQESTEKTKPAFAVEGQFVITTNGEAVFINMGGPALKFVFSKVTLMLNMMPSLRFEQDAPKPIATPLLGMGPQICLLKDKRLVLSFPCYYYATRNIWTASAGIGYVFTKHKK